jgi:hypothetical protein
VSAVEQVHGHGHLSSVGALDAMLDALDRLRGTSPEFGGFLANHGPMAADALIRLGGSAHVPAWVDDYRRGLHHPTPWGDDTPPEEWSRALGDIRLLAGWTELFRRSVAERGWRATLDAWWPRLLPGAAASAAHGIIRTAHAVRSLHDHGDHEPLLVDELVAALGYWASRYQPLPGAPDLRGRSDARTAVARLPRLDRNAPSQGPGIGGRLAALDGLDGLASAMDAWGPRTLKEHALDELVSAAARIVATRRDSPIAFCHAVTAPAAVRMILPLVPAEHRERTIATCWQLVAGIVAAFASPRVHGEGHVPWTEVPARDALARRAIAHADEHVIKLTEACLRQFDLTGDTTLLVAAERFALRLAPAR